MLQQLLSGMALSFMIFMDCDICSFLHLINIIITSTSDLQPSTAIANQLPGHLGSTQISTIGLNCFKFIIESTVPSTKIVQKTE